MALTNPSKKTLSVFLEYEESTGKIIWKERKQKWFRPPVNPASTECKRWNTRYSGKEASTTNALGYKFIKLFKRKIPCHVVAFVMSNGSWPMGVIDHINGNPSDNRSANLRDVPQSENNKNAASRKDNSSGVHGVSWCKRKQAWLARINVSGKNKHLGYYKEIGDAKSAREAASVKYGYHPNHGRPKAEIHAFA